MKLIFVTNFLTPHQLPLAEFFYNKFGKDYCLIETAKKEDSIPIGWKQDGDFKFVVSFENFSKNTKYYIDLITQADIVITGSAPDFLIKERLKERKLTFKYSERVYKKKCPWYEIPLRAIKYYFQFKRHKSLYLLCASAYTSSDYAKTGTFLNKTFKWGYFPETKIYDIETLISKKEKNSILWAARIIDWKHPELALEIARRLKNDGYDFMLNIIGTGDMEEKIAYSIKDLGLQDSVKILGSMSPHEVRKHMENSQIFLMTSDRKEGWGAVLNEAMNSGCVVVANSAAGSAPYLISDGENGFLYNEENIDDMYKKVKLLLDNPEFSKRFGEKAYYTITEQWNAENAAKRFFELSKNLLSGKSGKDLYENGVCSFADPINDNWYKNKDGET